MRASIKVARTWVSVLILAVCLLTLPAGERDVRAKLDETHTVTLIAVGDIMLSRAVARHMKAHNDINYPFLNVRDYLKTGDVVFGNLECPITAGRVIEHGKVFRADPGVEQALKNAGFNVLSLANNHLPDFGTRGVLDTMRYLDQAQITHVGAGENAEHAAQPVFVEKNGIRLAFLAYNDRNVVPPVYAAAESHPGTNLMNVDKLPAAVKAARAGADLVIVSMHSGKEYSQPNASQISFAHAAIDAGADLVLGHHPHVVQYVERYQGKYIFYSLGNFVFDQTWSKETTRGLMIRAVLSKRGVVVFMPLDIKIEHASQPRIVGRSARVSAVARASPRANR